MEGLDSTAMNEQSARQLFLTAGNRILHNASVLSFLAHSSGTGDQFHIAQITFLNPPLPGPFSRSLFSKFQGSKRLHSQKFYNKSHCHITKHLTPLGRNVREKLTVAHFMNPESSLPNSEDPAICPYPESDQSIPRPHPIS
jgi:hypothetical protein